MLFARYFAIPLAAILSLGGLSVVTPAAHANGDCATYFTGQGTGIAGDPYLVDSRLDLEEVDFCLSAHFLQTANIDLSGSNWTPLGNGTPAFSGTYDGGNFNISGLTINLPTTEGIGLFGYITNATLSRIRLTSGSITGANFVGALVGQSTNSSITFSSSAVTVTGVDNVGGLIGSAITSTAISQTAATGSVTGENYVGGLIGETFRDVTVANSFATGQVTSAAQGGGLIGAVNGETSPVTTSITNSYAAGLVSGTLEQGGFTGQLADSASFTGSTWDTGTTGRLTAFGSGTTLTPPTASSTSQMKTLRNFTDRSWSISQYFDGGTTWAICSAYNNGYPYLTALVSANPSGCSLTPVPEPAPAPEPVPTPAPTSPPTPEPTPVAEPEIPAQPAVPIFQEETRPVAPGVEVVTGEVISVTVPVRSDSPAGTTLRNAPTVLASTNEIIRVSIDGLAASSDVRVAMKVNGRWVRLGTASTGVKGRTTLPAFETSVPGIYELRIKGKGTGTRYVLVEVR